METRKTTKAGVLFWTPAPTRSSPTGSVTSEDVWEDEDEEQAEKEDDFFSQMDDNGIIGLSEALENVELGGSRSDADAENNPACYPGSLSQEGTDPSGNKRLDGWSYTQSEHLSFTEAPGEDELIHSSSGNGIVSHLKAQTSEYVRQKKDMQKVKHQSERDEHLDITEEEKEGKRSDGKRKKQICSTGELGAVKGLTGSVNREEIERIRPARPHGAHLTVVEPDEVLNHHCSVSQSASAATALPHVLYFTAEEIAAAPGIEGETFPDMGFTESLPESYSSRISHKSSTRSPRNSEKQELDLASADFPEQELSNGYSELYKGPYNIHIKTNKHHVQPSLSQRKMSQPSPEAAYLRICSPSNDRTDSLKSRQSPDGELSTPRTRTRPAEVNKSRNRCLSYRTPDFSKVEPKVCFPKGSYKPPKSKHGCLRKSLSPEPPLVFKSPADIVKEVLLNTTDGSPASSDSNIPQFLCPTSTVPQDFRCRQQATTLLEQLQEDYNRLLTKYAEAENTIDRLRLKAKVNIYSESPKPNSSMQSGLRHNASKFMTLDFPQPQTAQIDSASPHPNKHNVNQSLQLPEILYNQVDNFLQQMENFKDLLKTDLKPFEQRERLSQLAQGLSSLERGYLSAMDEHKFQQQQGVEISHFDPDRELEGVIYQCGLHVEELRELVERTATPQFTTSSVPSERQETLTHPQIPPVPSLVGPGGAAEVEVSSVSEESVEEEAEMDDEETLSSLYLKPPSGRKGFVEHDLASLMDQYQSFRELPQVYDYSRGEEAVGTSLGREETERSGQGHVPQRKAESNHRESPVGISKKQTSRYSQPPHRASSQSTLLSIQPPSSYKRLDKGKSHSSSLSSLGEFTATERRNSKLQPGSRRVLSQDGIISPETDSGFVGSESSHLTPAAAPSPVHQRAPQSVSVHQDRNKRKEPVSAPSAASAPSHSNTALEFRGTSQLRSDQTNGGRQRQRRRTHSCSPQRWLSQTEQTRADSGTSEFGLESDNIHSASEDGQSDQYTESINSLHSSHGSSSHIEQYHHGDSHRALGSRQVANRNDAIQTLQTEVTKLRERLERCLRKEKPPNSTRAAPSAQVIDTHRYTSTPCTRPKERCQSDVSRRRERRKNSVVEESTPLTRQKSQREISLDVEPPTPSSLPRVSRYTQTSSAAPDGHCSHSNTGHSRRTNHKHHPVSKAEDEVDNRSRKGSVCLQCSSRLRGRSGGPAGGNSEPTHSSSHCPLCGYPKLFTHTKPDCRRESVHPPHTSCQPAESSDGRESGRYAAAPPALLQCMPVYTPPLLLYSPHLYTSPSSDTGASLGVRGHEERRAAVRHSLSDDKQRSLDNSLNTAIRAAQHMKHTSRHMAHSLSLSLWQLQLQNETVDSSGRRKQTGPKLIKT